MEKKYMLNGQIVSKEIYINARKELVKEMKNRFCYLDSFPIEFLDDKIVGKNIAKYQPNSTRYLSSRLQSDKKIIMEAIKSEKCDGSDISTIMSSVGDNIKEDAEIIRVALEKNEFSFEFAGENLRSNREMVLYAIHCDASNIQYASTELCNDREIVLEAAKSHGSLLEYVNPKFRQDREIVFYAVGSDVLDLEYADDIFLNDKDIMLAMLKENTGITFDIVGRRIGNQLKTNRDFAQKAVEICPRILSYIDSSLQDDEEIVRKAVSLDGLALKSASLRLKQDPEIVELAAKQNGAACEYISAQCPNRKMSDHIDDAMKRHEVKNFVHFTNVKNLDSIVQNKAMIIRSELESGNYSFNYTDCNRLDGVKNSLSFSVSFPNHEMFATKRRRNPDASWCVLVLKADKILEKKCLFFAHNAASGWYKDRTWTKHTRYKVQKSSVVDFESMFAEKVSVKGSYNRKVLSNQKCYATSPQAEILCLENIPLSCIESCIFENEDTKNKYEYMLRRNGIRAEVDTWYFGKGPYADTYTA